MPQSYENYAIHGHLVSPRKVDAPEVSAKAGGLPEAVDLRAYCTPVESQGALGSCVANAFVSALEYSFIRSGHPATDLSRLFVYYNARQLSGYEGEDSGVVDNHAVAAIVAHGVCPETAWPYDISRFTEKPPLHCYEIATMFEVMQFARVPDENTMRATLAAGIPVSCGLDIPARWLQVDAARSGKIEKSALAFMQGEIAGHTMLCVGYDDRRGAYLFRNSWGTEWGRDGHVWMDYEVVAQCSEMRYRWAIGQISIQPQLAVSFHSTLTQMAAEVRKGAREDMAAALAARKRKIGGELASKLEAETAGFRSRLRGSTPGAPSTRSSLIGRTADGPGAGGGYEPRKGPGAGGGYGPDDGPGAGGGYDRGPSRADGPGAGGGYGPNDGPGAGGGYDD
jgi:hypothetical protein